MNGDTQTAFIRQRRALILISIVLIFVEWYHLRPTLSELNFLGNSVSLGNKIEIHPALWIAYAYWYWRYYIYFRIIYNSAFRSTYRSRFQELVGDIAVSRMVKEDLGVWEQLQKEGRTNLVSSPPSFERSYIWKHELARVRAQVRLPYGYDPSPKEFEKESMVIEGSVLVMPYLRAFGHTIFKTNAFTEYLLPFGLGATPVLLYLYNSFK